MPQLSRDISISSTCLQYPSSQSAILTLPSFLSNIPHLLDTFISTSCARSPEHYRPKHSRSCALNSFPNRWLIDRSTHLLPDIHLDMHHCRRIFQKFCSFILSIVRTIFIPVIERYRIGNQHKILLLEVALSL